MWLYVPYQSAQDTEDLNSESPQWQTLSRSATWKEMSRKPLSWYRAFKKDSYLMRLSGVTSKPSTVSRGVDAFISSLPVFHVSHSVSQDKNGKPTTSEIYGPTLLDSQGNSGTQLSFAKMFPESFDTTGKKFDQSFKQWATALRKDSTLRLKQALRTEGSDYSFWPTVTQDSATMRDKPYAQGGTPLTLEAANWRTPTSMESGLNPERVGEFRWGQRNYDKETGRLAQTGLTQQVKVWRTPGASDGEGGVMEIRPGTTGHYKLRDDVANWPTPQHRDYKSHDAYEAGTNLARKRAQGWTEDLNTKAVNWPTPTAGHPSNTNSKRGADTLYGVTENWMTPNTMDALPPKSQEALDHEHETARPGRATPNNLRDQASVQAGMTFWPTPATRDHKGFDSPGKKNAHQDPAMYHSIRPDQPIETDGHTCSTKCLRLNPLFAEWLMGLPQNWTALEDYGVSVTESYPLWRLSLGATLQRSCASLAH